MSIHPHITLGPVKLRVKDLARAKDFYVKALGLSEIKQEDGALLLGASGTPLVWLEEHADARQLPSNSATGLYHFAILLPSRKELGFVLRNLIALGIDVGQGDHLVSEAFYLSDPDGNGIEIYVDRPREDWTYDAAGNVNMATNAVDWQSMVAEAGEDVWHGMPASTVMGHVHFHVKTLEDGKRFYQEALGFDVMADWSRMKAMFLAAGGYHHHVGMNLWAGEGAPAVPEDAVGLDWWTLVYPDSAELTKAVETLRAKGYDVKEGDAYYVTDESGITARLTAHE